jgi:hypothetical protein
MFWCQSFVPWKVEFSLSFIRTGGKNYRSKKVP